MAHNGGQACFVFGLRKDAGIDRNFPSWERKGVFRFVFFNDGDLPEKFLGHFGISRPLGGSNDACGHALDRLHLFGILGDGNFGILQHLGIGFIPHLDF